MKHAIQVALMLAAISSSGLLGDGIRIPPCCLGKVEARTAQARKVKTMQGQEHHPGTCNNHFANEHPCKCHFAEQCPEYDDQGKPIPQGEDPVCQQYCDKGDCHCVGPCTS